jgi:hypothetical protein
MPEIINRASVNKVKRVQKPSLLRQIVDKVDEMDEGSKKLLLLSLKKDELMSHYNNLDKEIAKSGQIASEKEIELVAAKTRNEMYEKKIRS